MTVLTEPGTMTHMKTTEKTSSPQSTDCEALADLDILMSQIVNKKPIDPELARRVEQRADRAIEELQIQNRPIDIEKLVHDAREDS